MNPYSLDLRQKIVEAYDNFEGSQRQLAKRFHISIAFVQRLLNRYHNETNSNVFQVFVEKILVKCLWPGAVVVMDNMTAHQSAIIESLITQAGAKLIYLSPDSPDFNPIENC